MKRVLFFLSACNYLTVTQQTMIEHLAYRSAYQWVFNRGLIIFSALAVGLLCYLTLPSALAAEESTTDPAQNEPANTVDVDKEKEALIDPNQDQALEKTTATNSSQPSEQSSDTASQQAVEQPNDPAVPTATTQRRVAVVNIAVLMENSPRSQAIADKIKSEYFPQEQLLNKEREALRLFEEQLDAESTGLSTEERLKRSRDFRSRKRKYTRDYEDFRDRLSSARQRALALVRQDVLEAVDYVRTQAGVDIVLEDYVLASEEVDLTPKVLQYLQTLYQQATEPSDAVPTTKSTTATTEQAEDSATQSPIESINQGKQDEQPAQTTHTTDNKNQAVSGEEASP
ncbi:MAG TPA: OmpH family outer membrane protein [Thiothrix sp.]|nr:OmpH family outer membrane protein [Thiothrix sp.]